MKSADHLNVLNGQVIPLVFFFDGTPIILNNNVRFIRQIVVVQRERGIIFTPQSPELDHTES